MKKNVKNALIKDSTNSIFSAISIWICCRIIGWTLNNQELFNQAILGEIQYTNRLRFLHFVNVPIFIAAAMLGIFMVYTLIKSMFGFEWLDKLLDD